MDSRLGRGYGLLVQPGATRTGARFFHTRAPGRNGPAAAPRLCYHPRPRRPRRSSARAVPLIVKSALVPYPPTTMFDLVAGVEGYPAFLPWCASAEVLERDGNVVVASLTIAKGPVHKRFTTRNTMFPNARIDIRLVDGPFRHLSGEWRFDGLGADGCKVSLDLEFELSSVLLCKVLEPLFSEIAGSMVDAFCRRAAEVHGQ